MEVYYSKSDYHNGIGNYIIFINNLVFALTLNEYTGDNIDVKVGEIVQDKNYILINNNIKLVKDVIDGMKKLEQNQIPGVIKKRFDLWTH